MQPGRSRHRLRPGAGIAAAAALVGAVFGARRADGQIRLDGTTGRAGALQGPNYVIDFKPTDANPVGRLRGSNLFHSFAEFNIRQGESATFQATFVPGQEQPISNVIARVTGGLPSEVNGTLRSAIPGANFYLINPAGVMFGPEAALDVGGSFAVTTAAYLRLSDGTRFAAAGPDATAATLSTAAPAAFGFLRGRRPGPITYTGPGDGATSLQVGSLADPGKVLSVVGGAVTITSGRLQATGGRVNVVAVDSVRSAGGEVSLDPADPASVPQAAGVTTFAPVAVTTGSALAAPAGGGVTVRGGDVTLDDSAVIADTDVAPSRGADLAAAGNLVIRDSGVSTTTSALGSADGGTVRLSADALTIAGLAPSSSSAILTSTNGAGRGGDVLVDVGTLSLSDQGAVQAFSNGPGRGGDITVNARRSITIQGAGLSFLTGLAAETTAVQGGGRGGDVTLTAKRVDLINGGQISSTTKGSGDAGRIHVTAGLLRLDGQNSPEGSQTLIEARIGKGDDNSGATGSSGGVLVDAGAVELISGGVISASTFGSGPGGDVDVRADRLTIEGSPVQRFTGLFSRSTPTDLVTTAGAGGRIAVDAGDVRIGGPAKDRAGLTGEAGEAGISSRSEARGGPAGVVAVTADSVHVLKGGSISASNANKAVAGGGIELTARRDIVLRHGTITAMAAGSGEGARITVDPPAVVLADGSKINALAGTDPTFAAKPIDIVVRLDGSLLKSADSAILTNANLIFPTADLSGALAALPPTATDTGTRMVPQCGVRLGGSDVSTFLVIGRGGTPPEPGGLQAGGLRPLWVLDPPAAGPATGH